MRENPMLDLGLGPRDRLMGLGQFLNVVDSGDQRIVIALGRADLQMVQDNSSAEDEGDEDLKRLLGSL